MSNKAYVFTKLVDAQALVDKLTQLANLPKPPNTGLRNDLTKYGWTLTYAEIKKHPKLNKWHVESNSWVETQRLSGKITVPAPVNLTKDWFTKVI